MPDYAGVPQGLIIGGGIGQGLSSFAQSFQNSLNLSNQRKQNQAMLGLMAQKEGLNYDPDSGEYAPTAEHEAEQQAGLLKAQLSSAESKAAIPFYQGATGATMPSFTGNPGSPPPSQDNETGAVRNPSNFGPVANPEEYGGLLQQQKNGVGPVSSGEAYSKGLSGETEQEENSGIAAQAIKQPTGYDQYNKAQGLLGNQMEKDLGLPTGTIPTDPYARQRFMDSKELAAETSVRKARIAEDRASNLADRLGGTADTKQSAEIDKLSKAMQKDLDPDAARAGNFGQISNTYIQSQKMKRLATDAQGNIANLPKAQQEELALGMARMLGGGAGTDSTIKNLVPQSAVGNIESFKSWLLNQPEGANQQAFTKYMMGTIDREANLAQEQLNDIQSRRLGAHNRLKQIAPDQYNAILGNYGLDKPRQSLNTNATQQGLLPQQQAPIAHPQDSAAVEWAKSNPNDPRSAKILQLNGAQ